MCVFFEIPFFYVSLVYLDFSVRNCYCLVRKSDNTFYFYLSYIGKVSKHYVFTPLKWVKMGRYFIDQNQLSIVQIWQHGITAHSIGSYGENYIENKQNKNETKNNAKKSSHII